MAQESEEHKGVIFNIENNYENSYTPSTGPNAGVELFKHKVALVNGGEGVFYQKTKELTFNKEKCFVGQEICFTSKPASKEGKPMVFTMCNDRGAITPESTTGVADVSKINGVSFSYAKDIAIASFAGQGKTVDEYLSEIKRLATDIKNFLLENN
jgi:hypothetical protein